MTDSFGQAMEALAGKVETNPNLVIISLVCDMDGQSTTYDSAVRLE